MVVYCWEVSLNPGDGWVKETCGGVVVIVTVMVENVEVVLDKGAMAIEVVAWKVSDNYWVNVCLDFSVVEA